MLAVVPARPRTAHSDSACYALAHFRPCGVNHARAQNAELELADAALHAQKQPVIGMARVVDAVMIHDTRIYQAAKLQHVMPVAPFAGQARHFQAEDRADRPRTQHGDKPFEAGPGLAAAG